MRKWKIILCVLLFFSLGASFLQNLINLFDKPECTWYAVYKRPELGGMRRHAKFWNEDAPKLGFTVSDKPEIGAIAVFQPDEQDADPDFGHVAYVEQVFGDGTYLVSEMGWGKGEKRWLIHTRMAKVGDNVSFILSKANTPVQPPPSTGGGQATGLPAGEISYIVSTVDDNKYVEYFVVHNLATGADVRKDYLTAATDADYDWSPDGKKIINSSAYIYDFETYDGTSDTTTRPKVPEQFNPGENFTLGADHSWIKVGDKELILLVCRDQNGRYYNSHAICLTELASGETEIFAYDEGLYYTEDGQSAYYSNTGNPSLSRNGVLVYLTTQHWSRTLEIKTRSLVGLDTKTGNSWVIAAGEIVSDFPKISPDGTKIAFVGDSEKGGGIWTVNLDGSELKQITTGNILNFIDWSPDSNWIVFDRNIDDKPADIWILNVSTGKEFQITDTPEIHEAQPAWRR